MEFEIVTIQRTGSHLLSALMLQNMEEMTLIKKHDFDGTDGKTIITIARNPIDTIVSDICLSFHYDGWEDRFFDTTIRQYTNFGNEIIDRADIFIDYNHLISNPKPVIERLAKELNVKIVENNYKVNHIKDNIDNKSLRSSKTYKDYDKVMAIVKQLDLSRCQEVYERMIEKSKSFYDPVDESN